MRNIDYEKISNTIANSKRINLVGSSGSGKSTFGKKLATALNIPYIEIDQIFWGPNWQRLAREELFAKLEKIINTESWILDGNYSKTIDIKWKNVQTVIWLDYSFARIMIQTIKRAIYRMTSKKELWPGTGNKESFRRAFLSKESIILWSLSNFVRIRKNYNKSMSDPAYSYINFIKLKAPKIAKKLLEKL